MKRIPLLTIVLAFLASCGVDGEPIPPAAKLKIGVNNKGHITVKPTAAVNVGGVKVDVAL